MKLTDGNFADMADLFGVISLPHEQLPVDCEYSMFHSMRICSKTLPVRFAFVEYESRRDADDAYHEMHNKRIGRDDLLKIEVSCAA